MSLLDEPTYPFNDATGKLLLNKLADLYPQNQQIVNVVNDAGIHAVRIDISGSPFDAWRNVLLYAANTGELRTLVAEVRRGPYGETAKEWLDPLLAVQPDPLPPGLDAYELGLLPARRSFIDRAGLRGSLRDFSEASGARVLFVRGEHARGKSHSWHFISYLHETHTAPFTPYRMNLSAWTGPKYQALQVMDEIVASLGWEPIEVDRTAQPDTVVRLLVAKFKSRASTAGEICLVFDGFTAKNSDNYARKLIMELANAALAREAGGLRVILLEVDAPVPQELEDEALREDLGPGRLDDLRAFFDAAAKTTGEQLDQPAMDVLVTAVLGPPPHPGEFELREVGPRAAQVANQAFRRRT